MTAVTFRFPKMHLRTRQTMALIAFSLVPLAVAMGVGYVQSRKALLAIASERLEMLADLKAARMRTHVERHVLLAHRLQRDFAAVDPERATLLADSAAISNWLSGVATGVEGKVGLAILDLRGRVLASRGAGPVGVTWIDPPYLETGRIRTRSTGPHHHPGIDATVASTVYVPMRAAGGETIGELAVIGSSALLKQWLAEDTPSATQIELRDLAGRTVAEWPASSPRNGWSASSIEVTHRIAPGGAILVLRVPIGEISEPLDALGRLAIASFLVVASLAVIMAMLMGRALSRPVRDLAKQARRIGEGDLRPLPPPAGSDEIASLGVAMEQMRVQLLAAQDRLRQLLAERTASLRDHERLVASLFDVLPEIVVVVGRDRVVRTVNRTAKSRLGGDPEGRPCFEVLFGRNSECVACPLGLVLGGNTLRDVEPAGGWGTGEAVVYDLVPIGEPGQPAESAMYSGRIVTGERLLQQRLAHQEKMAAIGALAAGVAHEVGNPLASLSSLAQLRLRRGGSADDERDMKMLLDHLERIQRAVRSLTRIARHGGSGRQRVLLQDLAARAVQLVSYDPRARGVKFKSQLDSSVPALTLDEDAWFHALLNLLVNALDAVADCDDRCIDVTVQELSGNVVLRVRDSGSGMDSDVLRHARDPMFTTKPPGHGTGLGLHLVDEVVVSHGGRLSIDSTPGQGTSVTVTVTVAAAEHAAVPAVQSASEVAEIPA